MAKELKNKPLVEAILEVRWKLQGSPPGPMIDPHYKLLLARLFDRMHKDYPEHEELQTVNLPDELVGYTVQHRFRTAPSSWPLVQVGPGIFTVNSTADYRWEDFQPRALSAISTLYEAYPKAEDLKITSLVLRYIDAVDYDYAAEDVFEFLREKLRFTTSLPRNLFQDTRVQPKPVGFTWQGSFVCVDPKGRVTIRFATGQRDNAPAVIWETIVESAGDDLPRMPDSFVDWINASHTITDDWFFKMIEGELERRFSGE